MELLAPAGNMAALEEAVRGGADAVYLGTGVLNARRTAGNFDADALTRACDYCHERGRKVYVTVNTLIKQAEIDLLEDVARDLARAGADAAIVQDLGAVRALRQMLPSLPLHASTQMAIMNREGVRAAGQMGLTRVVLARELTHGEMAECAQEGLEIEVFGHGALCVSCSGQCLFSSMVGGRSGNRGLCAQPCRLPYSLSQDNKILASGDLLSPKDLCTIADLGALRAAGVASLKIEGRLKSPDYVYAVTSTYRRALDGEAVDGQKLREVFNRGFTRGYGPGVIDGEFLTDARELHVLKSTGPWPEPGDRRVVLTGHVQLRVGEPAQLTLSDGRNEVRATGEVTERAHRLPIDKARIIGQINKTGGSPYVIGELSASIDDDAFQSAAALNALRRDALAELGKARILAGRGCARAVQAPVVPEQGVVDRQRPLLCVASADRDQLSRALSWGADEIIWSPSDVTASGLGRSPDVPFVLAVPPVLSSADLMGVHRFTRNDRHIQGVILSNPSHLALTWPGEVRADFTLGAANAFTIDALGMPYAPSVELTAGEIEALGGERELIVYGRLPLMFLRHCPKNAALAGGLHATCRRCDHGPSIDQMVLVDRRRAHFPLHRLKAASGCIVRVMGNVPLMLLRHVAKLPQAHRWRVQLTDEPDDIAGHIVRLHRAAIDQEDFKAMDGWAAVDQMPSTTGHYFRGVE